MTDDLASPRTVEHSRARWTTYLLYTCLALDVIAIASGVAQRGLTDASRGFSPRGREREAS